ncbi:aldose 1-epimerase [Dyadobacter jejuensis]|uniref:Aldose 1-epimerase n=1 Tax=Dyadobacter jejuensis TaxID=1082580 RepID=A0A316AKX5_9BACT|nr:aldose epimerase family protein [Dyadobacter jejuensis]PWJ58028.1 aldose 1-epimerase [Dyadobacter jejuensis]
MKVSSSSFGEVDGQTISIFKLQNDQGMVVSITNYGATITSLVVPDATGQLADVVCGFDKLEDYFSEDYLNNAPYFGCTVGRYAGRIKDGEYTINGQVYKGCQNNGSNHLHGGKLGFDKKVWEPKLVDSGTGVEMRLSSPAGEEGYPGEVDITVTFTLTQDNQLKIRYQGTTDRETPLSLTNHSYFNLSGFEADITGHVAQVDSEYYLLPDATNVPVGERASVEGTPADLRNGVALGTCFVDMPTGFEHYYVFRHRLGVLSPVARFADPISGRTLEVSTTEPGMLFYTGYYTADSLKRNEGGPQFGRFKAFCCETSRYPNGPNIADAPGSTTKPAEVYSSETIFRFSW